MIKYLAIILTSFQLFAANLNFTDVSVYNTEQSKMLKMDSLLSQTKFSVFIAIDKDCPILQKYIPTINEIHSKYLSADIAVYLISRNSNITSSKIEEFAKVFKIKPAIFLDSDQKLLSALGMTTISQAILIDNKKMEILYAGRIDDKINYDSVIELSKNNYLEDAIKESLAGKKVTIKSTRTLGCSI